MKIALVSSALLALSSSAAVAFASNSANFNVSLKPNLQGLARSSCMSQIYQISKVEGAGQASVIFAQEGTVVLNASLTDAGAREVQAMPCVQAVELGK